MSTSWFSWLLLPPRMPFALVIHIFQRADWLQKCYDYSDIVIGPSCHGFRGQSAANQHCLSLC